MAGKPRKPPVKKAAERSKNSPVPVLPPKKRAPKVSVDPKSMVDLEVKKAAPGKVVRAAKKAGVKGSDVVAGALEDPAIGPLLERASFDDARWGKLAAVAPAEAMLQDVQRSHAFIEWCEECMNSLGGLGLALLPAPLSETAYIEALGQKKITAEEQAARLRGVQLRTLKFWWESARDQLMRAARAADAARLAERTLVLNEARAKMMAIVISAVFADETLGLTDEQRSVLPGLLRKHVESSVSRPAPPSFGPIVEVGGG